MNAVIGLEHETLSLNTFLNNCSHLEFTEKSSPSTQILFKAGFWIWNIYF